MSDLKPLLNGTQEDKSRLSAAIAAVINSNNYKFECMTPARVIHFDRARNVATVQPLITWVDLSDRAKERGQYAEIPVISIGGGGFHISFPLVRGDIGWIHAADRDMSQFLKSLQMAKPNTGRCHKFEDGMFIPDVFRQYTISGEDSGAMVIQSTSSATRISIRQDNIKITTPSLVTIDSPLSKFTGNVEIAGDVIMAKTLTVATEITLKGIPESTHVHITGAPGQPTGPMQAG